MANGRPEAAREPLARGHRPPRSIHRSQLPYVSAIRRAIESGIGSATALMGLASTGEWAERLEKDTLHEINALYLRRAIRLELGDWQGAERFRRQAEVLALRAHTRQMFASAYVLEISAHAMARDLTGLKQVMDRIEPLAAESPGWLVYQHVAEGHFRFICGEYDRALLTLSWTKPPPPPPHSGPRGIPPGCSLPFHRPSPGAPKP